MARRPFNLIAAVFYLIAGVIFLQVLATILAGLACYQINLMTVQTVGACMPIADSIRSQWDKIFEAILALLVAGGANRTPPPSSPPPPM